MPRAEMKVELIRCTPKPEELVAIAAKMCTSGAEMEELLRGVEGKDVSRLLRRVLGMGHESIAEHCSYTFLIEGVSRALLSQITRHRIASFSVQSQRYVPYREESSFGFVVPPSIEALGPQAVEEYTAQMEQMQKWYCTWLDRLGEDKAEDARFVLPNACQTRMMVTMNARELTHFFALRCCGRAQWEIRELSWRMLELVMKTSPDLFEKAGPPCVRGECPEGKRSCGNALEMRKRLQALKEGIQNGNE